VKKIVLALAAVSLLSLTACQTGSVGGGQNGSVAINSTVLTSSAVAASTLAVNIDTVDVGCLNSTSCNGLTLDVQDSTGTSVLTNVVTIPTTYLGGVYTVKVNNLPVGGAYTAVISSLAGYDAKYSPSSTVTIANSANIIDITFESEAISTPTPPPTTPIVEPTVAPGNIAGTYDFAMPSSTKNGIDYSGKFEIKFNPKQPVSNVESIAFSSTVANLDEIGLSYGNFYSTNAKTSWSKSSNSTTGLTDYVLKITNNDWSGNPVSTPLSSGGTLAFAWSGSNNNGLPLEQIVPIITNVKINGGGYVIDGICTTCTDPGKGKQIVGYQEQWSVYSAHNYYPENIPYAKLNTINYGFIDFVTTKGYPFAGNGSYGIYSADGGADYRQLVALWKAKQRYPYLKVVLSFGGWTNDGETIFPDINFDQMTDVQQQAFAKNAANLVKTIGFDGVDIDWEWWANHRTSNSAVCDANVMVKPGKIYCQGSIVNHSTQKYINLLKYLRQDLGSNKLLTIATVSAKDKILSDEDTKVGGVVGAWKQIAGYVDYINVMAYDMHGAFDNKTASQAPWDLDPERDPFYGSASGFSIKSSLQAYVDSGVPMAKLVLGFPAYGRASIINGEGATGGLYQASSGAPTGEFDKTGVFTYNCLANGVCNTNAPTGVTLHNKGTALFNSYGSYNLTPWASSGNMFITYDDHNSVKDKLNAACNTFGALGGGMVWALDGDSSDDTSIVAAVMNNINSCHK